MMFTPSVHDPYKTQSHLELDLSELLGLEDRLKNAIGNGTKASDISKQIRPAHILWRYGAPMGIYVLMTHTPVGDDFSNWAYYDYGSYVLYGEDHAKGTLRRGWVTVDPAQAESDKTLPIDYSHIRSHVSRNVTVRKRNKTTYWCDLENCVPYGCAVEYGHYVVYPGQRNKSVHVGGAKPTHPIVGSGKNGSGCYFVPPQWFVKKATTDENWKPVVKTMHNEYVKRFRQVIKK